MLNITDEVIYDGVWGGCVFVGGWGVTAETIADAHESQSQPLWVFRQSSDTSEPSSAGKQRVVAIAISPYQVPSNSISMLWYANAQIVWWSHFNRFSQNIFHSYVVKYRFILTAYCFAHSRWSNTILSQATIDRGIGNIFLPYAILAL